MWPMVGIGAWFLVTASLVYLWSIFFVELRADLIAVVCIVAWSLLGTNLSTTFNAIASSV
jgi:hypothetical protein